VATEGDPTAAPEREEQCPVKTLPLKPVRWDQGDQRLPGQRAGRKGPVRGGRMGGKRLTGKKSKGTQGLRGKRQIQGLCWEKGAKGALGKKGKGVFAGVNTGGKGEGVGDNKTEKKKKKGVIYP